MNIRKNIPLMMSVVGGDGDPIRYLIRDDFTDALTAGNVFGTAATGSGTRQGTDSQSVVSISGGNLILGDSGLNTYGDSGYYNPEAISRVPGRMMLARLKKDAGTHVRFGIDDVVGGTVYVNCFHLTSGEAVTIRDSGIDGLIVGSVAADLHAEYAVVQRAAGGFFFYKPAGESNWVLLYASSVTGGTTGYTGIANYDATVNADSVAVPDNRFYLPVPLASDGFGSAFGTTDGLGHAEGVAGGIGSGGAGVAWSDEAGDFTVDSGKAKATALDGGLGVQLVDVGTADFVCEVDVVRNGGACGLRFRQADSANYVQIRRYSSSFQLRQRVSGTGSTLFNLTPVDTSSGKMTVTVSGQDCRIYHKDVLVGTATIDASLTAPTVGLYTENITNTFDNFVVYARGSSGEHGALDGYLEQD